LLIFDFKIFATLKNKNFLLFLLLYCSAFSNINLSSAQAPPVLWSHCFGGSYEDHCRDMIQTFDGGFAMVGFTASNNGDVSGNNGSQDFWIVKTDANGNLQWQKCLGGTSDDEAHSIRQTHDGGYLVAGVIGSNDGNVTNMHGGYTDVWLAKLDASGNLLWEKALGGSLEDGGDIPWVGGASITLTNDGGFIIVTSSKSNDGDVSGNHGDFDCWVIKFDSIADIEWQKCYGGSLIDYGGDIMPTSDGGYLITSSTQSSDGDVIGNVWNFASWIFKTDSVGTIQ
jgi:hypothetical protein